MPDSSQTLFTVNKVRMGYLNNPVLTIDHLEIRERDLVFLKGANGSGKSTLVKTLCGLLKPLEGRVGTSLKNGDIGYLAQKKSVNLNFPLTVEKLVSLSAGGLLPPASDRIIRALEKVGLESRRKQLLRECSGGELQRALFASVMINPKKVLILDEPESNMDSRSRNLISEMIAEFIHEKGTVLWVSHYSPETEYEKRRVLHFREGKIDEE